MFIKNMLTNHSTRLKFDNHTLDWFPLDNGIGQGDLLSIVLYLFYNSNILEVPRGKHKMGLGYVDDMAFVVIDPSFPKAHNKLKGMMTHSEGRYDWSVSHNSTLSS